MEVGGQLAGVGSDLPPWVLGLELRLSSLAAGAPPGLVHETGSSYIDLFEYVILQPQPLEGLKRTHPAWPLPEFTDPKQAFLCGLFILLPLLWGAHTMAWTQRRVRSRRAPEEP